MFLEVQFSIFLNRRDFVMLQLLCKNKMVINWLLTRPILLRRYPLQPVEDRSVFVTFSLNVDKGSFLHSSSLTR